MANAKRDGNYIPAIQGVSSVDGITPIDIYVDPTTNEVLVKTNDPLPTSGNNPSLVLGYTGDNLTTITKTIGAVSYVKTLTYSGSVLTNVSSWVEQ